MRFDDFVATMKTSSGNVAAVCCVTGSASVGGFVFVGLQQRRPHPKPHSVGNRVRFAASSAMNPRGRLWFVFFFKSRNL